MMSWQTVCMQTTSDKKYRSKLIWNKSKEKSPSHGTGVGRRSLTLWFPANEAKPAAIKTEYFAFISQVSMCLPLNGPLLTNCSHKLSGVCVSPLRLGPKFLPQPTWIKRYRWLTCTAFYHRLPHLPTLNPGCALSWLWGWGGGTGRQLRTRANIAVPGELCLLESFWCGRWGQRPSSNYW